MTMSDMVGFSFMIASKLAGCDADAVGSMSSSTSSSDSDDDDDEWLTRAAAADDDDGWHGNDIDSSAFATPAFGLPSSAAVVFAGTALPSPVVFCRFAGILPTNKRECVVA